ncbi:hypothetical protein NIES4072_18040 [Nostoc commune NIES-4072]|uniref:Uncharacterized protein n=2 Tax=Nostoc commune TaxID=1178 RepID=A0A2R5FHM5_NOSCO|nr:hypothetical protein NIES4070_08770 [Nostoc commune HK-02]GBG18140.1 hypothetical protein NIES4072_18040 [Nostoc commune NIES-4072]
MGATRGIIRTSVAELDPNDLKGQLNELRAQVYLLLEIFDEKLLQEVISEFKEVEKTLFSVASSPKDFKKTEDIQLTLLQEVDDVKAAHNLTHYNDDVVLDGVHRTIQNLNDRLEVFCHEKRYTLQKELGEITRKLKKFTLRLKASKVSEPILSTSSLEDCLNDYRKTLEKQFLQLDKDCYNLASSVVLDEADILKLHHQLNRCKQFLQTNESTRKKLQDLVAGLEQWRIILTGAENLRNSLNNDSEHLLQYDDEFVDRVVEHFSRHGVESFIEYDLLQKPLVEIEEQIKGERRLRRKAFEQLLNQYQALLSQIIPADNYLKNRCKYDDEDCEGSYEVLREIVLEKLVQECGNQISNWEQIEKDLCFIAQNCEHDVTELLNQVSNFKTQLLSKRDLLLSAIADLKNLESQINEIKFIFEKCVGFREELRKIMSQKHENLLEEEKKLLSIITTVESGFTISQIFQTFQDTQDVWKILKNLYEKGRLEIILRQRD